MRPRRVAAVALLLVSACTQAQESERFPEFTAPVVDTADVVPDDVEQRVNDTLNAYQRVSTNQIAVAVIETTGDASLEDYTIDLARRWGVGTAEKDSGVLLLIAVEDRRLRIEVGSGLEGELTDLESGRIISERITPLLREGDYGAAVEAGMTAIQQAIGGELAPQPVEDPEPQTRVPGLGFAPIFILIFVLLSIFRGIGRRGYRRRRGWGGWMAPILIGTALGGRGGRSGGGFGGGGGFSGGGGGGFSGGGASGSW